MAILNLRGEPPPAEEPPPLDEPLGLGLIRAWLAKPRPRLYRLWLWVPLTAKGIRKAYGWLRANTGPALRRTARTLRKTATIIQQLRRTADRIGTRLEAVFPPGSRGREVAGHLADGSRLFGRSVLVLLGLAREADRLPPVFEREREHRKRPPEPEPPSTGTGPVPALQTPEDPAPNEPGASTGAGPRGGDETDPPSGPAGRGDPDASPGPEKSPTDEVSQPEPALPKPSRAAPSESEPSQPGRSQPEPSPPEAFREDPPDRSSAEPASSDISPVPGLPPGPRAEALAKLPKRLRVQILTLGKRPRKATLRYTIWRILNECGPSTSEDVGLLLRMDAANLAKRHLSPLVEEGVLERTIPDHITHPEQAYRSTRRPPG